MLAGDDSSDVRILRSRHRERATTWSYAPKVRIDYSKLLSLCKHCLPASSNDAQWSLESHEMFMKEYPSILQVETPVRPAPQARSHSCNVPVQTLGKGDIGAHVASIHKRSSRQREAVGVTSRLRAMATIVKKVPLKRTDEEVKQLARYLSYFPEFLPDVPYRDSLREAVAGRAIAEVTNKESCSLPGSGGLYLILQGKVHRVSRDFVTFSELRPGCAFGEIEADHPTKSASLLFQTCGPCVLMRVTSFDYNRATEQCLKDILDVKTNLVKLCPLLKHVSFSVVGKLAEAITWETHREGQVLAREGDIVERVGFIHEGMCSAYAKVPPRTAIKSAQVAVGVLKPHDCISEGLLRGVNVQPYTVVAMSRVRIGWISQKAIHAIEIEKHIPTGNPYALPIHDKSELRDMYAKHLMTTHWQGIKSSIVGEIVGAKPGRSTD